MPIVYVLVKHWNIGERSEVLAVSSDAKQLNRTQELLTEHGHVTCEVVPVQLEE